MSSHPDAGTSTGFCRSPAVRIVSTMLLALWLLPLFAASSEAQRLRTYEDRYGNTVLAPGGWTKAPDDERWEGSRLISPDGRAWLAAYTVPHRFRSMDAHIRSLSKVPGERITYIRRGNGWFVTSGFTGDDRIFYRKAVLACGGRLWRHIALEYPRSLKRTYDGMVTSISHALISTNSGCGRG